MIRVGFVFVVGALMASTAPSLSGIQAQAQRRAATVEDTASGVLAVQTIALKHLDVKDAARLIAPYLQSARSGAFEAGSKLGVITVRGTNRELQEAVSLLAEYDRAPRTVRLRFQLIEPSQVPTQDPRINEVSGALRELFAAPGYRLLGEGLVTTVESNGFELTISAGSTPLHLNGRAQRTERDDSGIRLFVALHQNPGDANNPSRSPLFIGSLTAVVGQVVVFGSAVPLIFGETSTNGPARDDGASAEKYSRRTIILTVQPQWDDQP